MIKKFKKKPVVIEAIQFNGYNFSEIYDWIDNKKGAYPDCYQKTMPIETLEGVMIASVGDWIIKGVKGEFYPCKPDIFESTYEEI